MASDLGWLTQTTQIGPSLPDLCRKRQHQRINEGYLENEIMVGDLKTIQQNLNQYHPIASLSLSCHRTDVLDQTTLQKDQPITTGQGRVCLGSNHHLPCTIYERLVSCLCNLGFRSFLCKVEIMIASFNLVKSLEELNALISKKPLEPGLAQMEGYMNDC